MVALLFHARLSGSIGEKLRSKPFLWSSTLEWLHLKHYSNCQFKESEVINSDDDIWTCGDGGPGSAGEEAQDQCEGDQHHHQPSRHVDGQRTGSKVFSTLSLTILTWSLVRMSPQSLGHWRLASEKLP